MCMPFAKIFHDTWIPFVTHLVSVKHFHPTHRITDNAHYFFGYEISYL